MKWESEELKELEDITNTDSNYDLPWEMVADHLNREFDNKRTAESCRKRQYRLLSYNAPSILLLPN